MGKTYWMLVTTSENFELTRSHGFEVQGVDSSQRRKALRLNTDDRVVFYLSDHRKFTATATVTAPHFEDHTRIWKHHKEGEVFPHRVKIQPDALLSPDQYLDAYQIGPRLEYVRKWPPEEWELAFIGGLHIIPQKDFSYLEDEMQRILSSQEAVRGTRRRRNRRGRRRSHLESARADADFDGQEPGESPAGDQEVADAPAGDEGAPPASQDSTAR